MKKNAIVAGLGLIALTACQQTPEKELEMGFDVSSLDSSVAPCENFFQFTAGGWLKENPIPGSESRWGKFNILAEENRKKIKTILDELNTRTDLTKGSDEQLVGDLFAAGMDSARIEELGTEPIRVIMEQAGALQSAADYISWLGANSIAGPQGFFGFYVAPDDKESSINILQAYQTGLGLPDRDYYLKDDEKSVEIQQAYIKHITNMFVLYGVEEAEAAAKANRIYLLEKEVAAHHLSRVEQRNPQLVYNKMTAEEFQTLCGNINMGSYFKGLGLDVKQLNVTSLEYMKWLGMALPTWNIQALRDHAQWQILSGSASALSHAFVAEDFDFSGRVLSGTKEMKERWKRVQGSMNGLSEQIGHLYVKKYFSEESKKKVETMVEDLRKVYKERVAQLAWMSDETKAKAQEKLDGFTYKIGYPSKWKDYSDVDIRRDAYYFSLLNLNAKRQAENFAKMDQPVDRSEWGMGAHIVNAYYNPSFNEVVFPAGILQPPFFNPEADDAINYGAIGGVIGHEFTHGFDDQGAQYDVHGNLVDWWTEEDKARFQVLAEKVAKQYDQYSPLPGVYVNGHLTLGENIADLGGLTLAYHAYLKHIEGKPEPALIKGFTGKQRVFLGWAQVWTGHSTEEYVRNQVTVDPHSPGMFRVIGPMSNMVEFKEAFGCQPGSMMELPDSLHSVIW